MEFPTVEVIHVKSLDVCTEDCIVFLTAAVFTVLSMPLVSNIGRICTVLETAWRPAHVCSGDLHLLSVALFRFLLSCSFSPGSFNFNGIFVCWFCNLFQRSLIILAGWPETQIATMSMAVLVVTWSWKGASRCLHNLTCSIHGFTNTILNTLFEITARRGHLMFHVLELFLICLQDLFYTFCRLKTRRFSFHDGPESLRLTTGWASQSQRKLDIGQRFAMQEREDLCEPHSKL